MTDADFEGERKEGEFTPREKKIAERIVLELYCQYELSLPFREIIGPEVRDLLIIRNKLVICGLFLEHRLPFHN